MGPWKRRVTERVKQVTGFDRGFRPTSNARLAATFNETKKFADALRKYDKQVSAQLTAIKDFHKQSQQFLMFNVPRMHQETRPGEATSNESESVVGANIDFDKIITSAEEGETKIYQYVQEPLRQWLANFDTVVVAIQTVEHLRLVLDSRRRTVAALEGDITNLQTKTPNPQDPKLMMLVERKHRQEVKLTQVHDDFHQKEVTTYQNMRHLVNDVKYVQQHIHKLFDVLRQISGDVCDGFPDSNGLEGDAPTTYISRPNDADFPFTGAGADGQYSDQLPQHDSDAHGDDTANLVDGALPFQTMDRYGNRPVAVTQSAYNPV